jgi:predicted deacylase
MSLDEEPKPVKVRVDYFMAEVFNVEIDVTPEAMEAMAQQAEAFLRCGGMVWDKWSLLNEASRTAFLMAAERVRNGNGIVPANQP